MTTFITTTTVIDQIAFTQLVTWMAWILLHFVWQGTVIALVLGVLLKIVGSTASSRRYVLACLAMFAIVISPVITGFLMRNELRVVSVVSPVGFTFPLDIEDRHPNVSDSNRLLPSHLEPPTSENLKTTPPARMIVVLAFHWCQNMVNRNAGILVAGWLLGVSICAMRLFSSLYSVHILRRTATPITDAALLVTFDGLIQRLTLNPGIRLMQSTAIAVPAVIGWIRPVVLFPIAFTSGLSFDQIEALLAHELGHVKRHDYLVNLMQTFVETVLFYHPAVWWISNTIRSEREHCCDAIALQLVLDKGLYANTLFELAQRVATATPLPMSARGGSLTDRIRRILKSPAPAPLAAGPVVAFTTVLVLFFTLFVICRPKVDADDSKVQKSSVSKEDARNEKTKDADPQALDLHADEQIKVPFVIAKHVNLYNGQIVTWKEMDRILDELAASKKKLLPQFLLTTGGGEREEDLRKWKWEMFRRLDKDKRIEGLQHTSAAPEASKRFDRIQNADDLKPDESLKRTGIVLGIAGKPVKDAEIVVFTKNDQPRILIQHGWLANDAANLQFFSARSNSEGEFSIYPDSPDYYVAAVHPEGFFVAFGEAFTLNQSTVLELEPWVYDKPEDPELDLGRLYTKQLRSFAWLTVIPCVPVITWGRDIGNEGVFGQRELPRGSRLVAQTPVADSAPKKTTNAVIETHEKTHEVVFVVAEHVNLHEGRIVTWDDIEQILDVAGAKYPKIHPSFMSTNGGLKRQQEFNKRRTEIYKRLHDSQKEYPLEERHGPWMIMVATFSDVKDLDGEKKRLPADQTASRLIYELRKKGIPAYAFSQGAKKEKIETDDRSGNRDERADKSQLDTVSVLAGNYPKADNPVAQKTLALLKTFRPKFMTDAPSGGIVGEHAGDQNGPFDGAFLTMNPVLDYANAVRQKPDNATKNFDGMSIGSMTPRASRRYDRIKNAADLIPDEASKLEGTVIGADENPVEDAEVFLLPADDLLGSYFQNGRNRQPYQEHLVRTDKAGMFAIYRDDDEVFIVAVHPKGFCLTTLEDHKANPTMKLKRWARIHGDRPAEGDDANQSVNFTCHPINGVTFNLYETEIAKDGSFDQFFLPPGDIVVMRSLKAGSGSVSSFVSKWTLKPGESEEVILGPIPEQEKQRAADWAKRNER